MLHRQRPYRPFAAWVALGIGALTLNLGLPTPVPAQVGPEESARKIKPADGLKATLWAAEPMVVNPTNMDVDSRGRVWITEGLNYRLHRNKGKERVEGADKIKILEDTDGDGKADKVTVFADNIFPVPMGLAVEEHYGQDGKYQGCRVFVGNSPDLLVFEDTDGDDKADKRSALLTGFGGIDSDHGVHGMALGLDGKLYFTHGDGCCSVQQNHSEKAQNFDVVDRSGRHVSSDQLANTLRVNRDGTQFEVLADRQRNNYETCFNAFGNVFTSDNDDDGNRGCRVIHVLDGGHYGYRTPGSPRHWGEDVPGNMPKLVGTGNGSPCGIMVYEGSLFPKEYRGAILEAEAGTRQINHFPLTRKGASFRTEPEVFLGSDDPWFRPVDMTAAPDGAVFVADWYDSAVGGHSFRDQTTGRIYRVVPIGTKIETPKHDFGSIKGLIHALRSPTVAAQDAARRLLIERAKKDRDNVEPEVVRLYSEGEPHERARALWVLAAIAGDRAATDALTEENPRLREQAVRILGRDDRENGRVEYKNPEAKRPPTALAHLDVLLPLAADPDAGVRRELILALRNLPTDKVGDALTTLARTWDGQDRWYLEVLGLALEKREAAYLSKLFDGTLYGDLDLEKAGSASRVALPPYFPVDRNEAFIATGAEEPPASALSKTIGLAWRLHCPESLPLLGRIMPKLESPELQQAAEDVLRQMREPETAVILAEIAHETADPARKLQIYAILARKLDGDWHPAHDRPRVVELIHAALGKPATIVAGMELAAATRDARYADILMRHAEDTKAPIEVRVAAIEAIGAIRPPACQKLFDRLIAETIGKASSNPVAEAAVGSLPRLYDARHRLIELFTEHEYPLGLRRKALRTLAVLNQGSERILALAREGKLPKELKVEATTALNTHPDRRVREQAAKVLPLPKTAAGRPLPPIFDLIRREGLADRGRSVFFRVGPNPKENTAIVACGGCHRVQGQGQWVGPDLSTIGTKYGKEELLHSILNPSAAIGYNFRAVAVATKAGLIYTGLPIEDTADRLVLKTVEGQRVLIRPRDVEDRTFLDSSLMPEGLAETMGDQELVDLLAFLSSLREPVSIVGQYHAIGPVSEPNGMRAINPSKPINLDQALRGPEGQKLSWRRLDANAEGAADFAPVAGKEAAHAIYAYASVVSPMPQEARLVFDTRADIQAWLGGEPVALPKLTEGEPRAVVVNLPKGASDLLIRVSGGPVTSLVTTFVSPRPVAFGTGEGR